MKFDFHGSHVNENEVIIFFQKFEKKKKKKKSALAYCPGETRAKIGRTPCIKSTDNCDTDGRTTDDGQIAFL